MSLGDDIKSEFVEDFEKEMSRKIVSGIENWREAGGLHIAQKRWLFELIQNALDVARLRNKKSIKIVINTEKNKFTFKHNGGYFTSNEIRALIFAFSTKAAFQWSPFL